MIKIYMFKFDKKAYSTNEMYKHFGKRTYKCAKYNFWRNQIDKEIDLIFLNGDPIINGDFPLKGELYVDIHFHFKSKRKRDIDNCLKSLFDAFNKKIWDDDSQVVKLTVTMHKNADKDLIDVKMSNI